MATAQVHIKRPAVVGVDRKRCPVSPESPARGLTRQDHFFRPDRVQLIRHGQVTTIHELLARPPIPHAKVSGFSGDRSNLSLPCLNTPPVHTPRRRTWAPYTPVVGETASRNVVKTAPRCIPASRQAPFGSAVS